MAANYIVSSSLFIKTVVETLYLKNCLKTYAVDPDQRESKGDVKNYMQVFEIKSNGLILNRRKRPKSDESSYSLTCYKVDTRMDDIHVIQDHLNPRWRLVIDRDACVAFWKQT